MKKVVLFFAIAIAAVSANAQTEKGNKMVGVGVAGINFASQSGSSEFNINLNPNVAWFIQDNFALGGGVQIGYSKPENVDGIFSYGITPLARYYFTSNSSNGLFGQVNLLFGGYSQSGNSGTQVGAGAGLGYDWFITKNVALEAGLGYMYTKPESVDAIHNVGLNLGFQIFLGKKK